MKKLLLSVAIAAISFSTLAAEKLTPKEFSYIEKGIVTATCQELGFKSDIDVLMSVLPLNETRPDVVKALTRSDMSYVISVMSSDEFLSLGITSAKVENDPAKYCK